MAQKTRKLFEYLVVEGHAKAQAERTRNDLANTFDKKQHLFAETRTTFLSNAEGAEPVVEAQSTIQSDVMKELRWLADFVGPAMDVAVTVQLGNRVAQADVEVDGQVILTSVPATGLLAIDARLGEFLTLLAAVPTLDPAKGFTPDLTKGERVYKARDVRKIRTKKEQRFVIAAPATDKHPAQVKDVVEDVAVGTILEQQWSGLITPAHKSQLLARCERLRAAVKQAIQRANAVEVPEPAAVGAPIFRYILSE